VDIAPVVAVDQVSAPVGDCSIIIFVASAAAVQVKVTLVLVTVVFEKSATGAATATVAIIKLNASNSIRVNSVLDILLFISLLSPLF
jgi:hypothetical protein